MHDDPERKKIAIVATAHWLVRVAAAMLRTGECWRERRRSDRRPRERRRAAGRRHLSRS